MIYAIENKKNHRCNGQIALHVLDLIESTMISAEKNIRTSNENLCLLPFFKKAERIAITKSSLLAAITY